MKRSNDFASGSYENNLSVKKQRYNGQQSQPQFTYSAVQPNGANGSQNTMFVNAQDIYGSQYGAPVMGQFMQYQPTASPLVNPMGTMGFQMGTQFIPNYQMGDINSMGGRTLYIGNIPLGTTIEEICSVIKTGMLEHIKILEDKNCAFVSFVEASAAAQFHSECATRVLAINGQAVKVGFGNKILPIPADVQAAISVGASRNVFIGGVDETVDEIYLHQEFSKFGLVDQIKILRDKHYAFIHMSSISSAVKAVQTLPTDPNWAGRKLGYGKDRCLPANPMKGIPQQQQQPQQQMVQPMTMNMFGAPQQMQFQGFSLNGYQLGMDLTMQNRTIYIGNIPPEATLKDLCDVIRGGILEKIKLTMDKKCAFATFMDIPAAQAFYNRGQTDGVVVKGKRVRINWGKPSMTSPHIQQAVLLGASRNVYIGNIDTTIYNEEKLRNDFAQFGEIELVNLVPEKNAGFVNFIDIAFAIRAVEAMKLDGEYAAFRVNFGKDRCGQMPRIKERNGGVNLQPVAFADETAPGTEFA
ncbi:hypothetical protein HK096_001869 [Nowakowskiella sp. JEL0078]|nr:hypothetical protein HK096_001869 [Nowakowskiella sp. JEL0078]